VAARAPAALRRRLPLARAHEPLALQPVERGVHGADGDLAPGAPLDLAPHGHPVAVTAQVGDGEQHHLLELPEIEPVGHGAMVYIVEEIRKRGRALGQFDDAD
jgi:hypothetical protein